MKENHRLLKKKECFKWKLWQREILNDFFIKNPRPTDEDIKDLSLKTKRNEKSVKKWFYNKKHSLKKKSKTSIKQMTLSELKTLEPFFEINQTPNSEELKKLGDELGLDVVKLYNWFANRRKRTSKKLKNSNLEKRYGLCPQFYSPEQKILLEKEYQKCKNPSFDEKKRIGRELSVDVIKIHIWFANRRKRKNDSLIERENTRLNQNKNSSENSFSTQPSESENHIFDQNLNGLAPKHHPSINIDDEVLLPEQNTGLSINKNHQTGSLFSKENDSYLSQFTNGNENNLVKDLYDKNENSVFVDPSVVTPTVNNLYEDLDDLIGDTSLFPEIFNDPNFEMLPAKSELQQQ